METATLETTPKNNQVAVSTPSELNYNEIVRRNAKRKADNGAQFTSAKGKSSLLTVCIDECRSQLGISKRSEDGKMLPIPDDVFKKIRASVESFWFDEARLMVERAHANDAHITVRTGILMTRISDKGEVNRSKTDTLKSVYKPGENEHRLCDTFGLSAAKQRLDVMLDNVGKFTRAELDIQRRKIAQLEELLNGKPVESK